MPTTPLLTVAGFGNGNEGWAFGDHNLFRWNGLAWLEQPASQDFPSVTSTAFLSTDDGWVVGLGGFIAHWNGSSWVRTQAPGTDEYTALSGVDFVSPNEGWIVGTQFDPRSAIVKGVMYVWKGSAWSQVVLPSAEKKGLGQGLTAIKMVSATDGWAAGTDAYILRWNGDQWTVYENRNPGGILFTAIAMTGANDGWMTGKYARPLEDTAQNEGGLWRWDGRKWFEVQRTRLPLYSLSMVSSQFGWVVGGQDRKTKIENGSLILNWNGKSWLEYQSPTNIPLYFVWAASTSDGWIFGGGPNQEIQAEYPGVVLRYRLQSGGAASPMATISANPAQSPTLASAVAATSVSTPQPAQTANPSVETSELAPSYAIWFAVVLLSVTGISLYLLLRSRRRN